MLNEQSKNGGGQAGNGHSGNGHSDWTNFQFTSSRSFGEDDQENVSLQEYIQIILRRIWIVVAAFVAVFISTVIFTLNSTPVYEATSTVLVNTKGQKQGSLLLFDPAGMGMAQNLNNELEILKSRSLAEAVAGHLLNHKFFDGTDQLLNIIRAPEEDELNRDILSLAEITWRVINTVSFDPVRDSDVIKITASSSDPREAALIANLYSSSYYDRNLRMSRTKSKAAREFLASQLQKKHDELQVSEEKLQNYMERSGIVSLDEEATKIIEQLSSLEAIYDNTEIELESVRESLNFYRKQIAKQEPNVAKVLSDASDPYIKLLQDELAKKEVERDIVVIQNPNAVDQEIYNDKLREIDAQIGKLREKLESRTQEYLRSIPPGQVGDPTQYLVEVKQKVFETQLQMQALQSKKQALSEVIQQYQQEFDQIPQKSIALARLQRKRLSTEKLYLLVEEKYQEATIAEQSEFGYIEIIDKAIVPTKPVSPKTRLNLLLGALIGLGLGIGLVFLLEYIDVSIRTPEDLKKRGIQPLTIVPTMDDGLLSHREAKVQSKKLDDHLLAYINPRSSVAEAYRKLRTNLQYSNLDKKLRTLVVTSPNPREGKSTTVSNLAITFAQAGKKTLLVDTDLRRPSVHRNFGVKKEPGVVNYLFGKNKLDEVVLETEIENLHIIPSGIIPPNPSEILASQKMTDFIEKVKSMYEVVLFDSPPVLAVTDASILSTAVDGIVLMVSAGTTLTDELIHSLEQLQRVNSRVFGVALNNFDLKRAYGSYYGQYKSRYYGYYGYYTYGSGTSRKKSKRRSKSKSTESIES